MQPASPMTVTSTTQSANYNKVAKFLHWLIALAIIGMLAIGWIMTNHDLVSGPLRFSLFQWHKSVGITILVLSVFRLIWRLTHTVPPLPPGMPAWERYAAHASHWLFYVLIIGMPLSGWMLVSASPFKSMLYGLVTLPNLPIIPDMEQKQEFGKTAENLHGLLAYVIAGLLVLHAGAAWKHHLFERDNVLLRMAPNFLHPLLHKIRGDK